MAYYVLVAVHVAICSQEQLVPFVGKRAVSGMAVNSAGLQRHCLSYYVVPLSPSRWPCEGITDAEEYTRSQ